MKSKFNVLFEEIMNNIPDSELYGNDIIKSTLKIYNFDGTDFADVETEILNFEFLEPNSERQEIIDDYCVDEFHFDEDDDIKKIIVFDKYNNQILFDKICYTKDVNRVLENIDFTLIKENRSFDPYLSIGLYGTVELMQDKQTKKFLAKPVSEFEYIDLDANTKEEAEKEIFIRWPVEANKE